MAGSVASTGDPQGRFGALAPAAIVAMILAGYALVIMPLATGADLAPLLIAARLIARGRVDAIYAHDAGDIDIFDHNLWVSTADAAGYAEGRYYLYLYPPLWPALLAPLSCMLTFKPLFWAAGVANLAAVGLSFVIAAAQWNRAFLRPLALTAALAVLCASYPLFKTVLLGQVQPIVMLLVVIAIAASQTARPRLAGAALAAAAAIKLVPAVIALYWVFNRRRDCALWFGAIGAGLAAISVAATGWDAHVAFLEALAHIAEGYAISFDNQSLIAWLGEAARPTGPVYTIPIQPVPGWVRATVAVFAASCIVALIRSAPRDRAAEALAMFGLFLVVTIAAPLAWLHYCFCLAIPLIILGRDLPGRACGLAIASLLSLPTTFFVIAAEPGRSALLTWGGAIASLAVLALTAIRIRQAAREGKVPSLPMRVPTAVRD